MLYSSLSEFSGNPLEAADANTYRPFKVLDGTVMRTIAEHVENLGSLDLESAQYMLAPFSLDSDRNI